MCKSRDFRMDDLLRGGECVLFSRWPNFLANDYIRHSYV